MIVYTKDACQPCKATKRKAGELGLTYTERDVSVPEYAAQVRSLGYSGVPVVVAGDEDWQGYRPDRLMALAA